MLQMYGAEIVCHSVNALQCRAFLYVYYTALTEKCKRKIQIKNCTQSVQCDIIPLTLLKRQAVSIQAPEMGWDYEQILLYDPCDLPRTSAPQWKSRLSCQLRRLNNHITQQPTVANVMGLKSFVTVPTLCNAGRFFMPIIQHWRKNARGKFNQKLYIDNTPWYNIVDTVETTGGFNPSPRNGVILWANSS